MSVENLKLWLKGEYVSPQDFKESLEKVIKQAEQYKSALSDIANGKYSIIRQHKLKIWPKYFQAVANGIKTFEIRKNDRVFRIGDRLILQEYDPETKTYSGREIKKKVVYITDFEQKENYVVMAIV